MELSNSIVESLVIGAITGYFIGYILKKLMHLALTIGIFALVLMYMSYSNAITLNFEEIGAKIQGTAEVLLNQLGFATLLSNTPLVGSLMLGLFFGLSRG